MNPYPAIEDHGLIGDLQTAALVATDGTIDWFCAPRFDSPSIFAALLDQEKGGHFRVAPDGVEYVTKQLYLPGTPILITRFMSADGVGEVVDFMPIAGDQATDRHRSCAWSGSCVDRCGSGSSASPASTTAGTGRRSRSAGDGATFRSPTHDDERQRLPARDRRLVREEDIQRTEQGVRAFATLDAGDVGGMVLETAPDGPPRVVPPDEILRLFEQTRDFWRGWIGRSTLPGPLAGDGRALGDDAQAHDVRADRRARRRADRRAAGADRRRAQLGLPLHLDPGRLVLGLRAARPGLHRRGAGVPAVAQRPGQGRRRASRSRCRSCTASTARPTCDEETLDHFEGYRGSSPVRIGNGAAGQLQLDIYGEALDSVHLADTHGLRHVARRLVEHRPC